MANMDVTEVYVTTEEPEEVDIVYEAPNAAGIGWIMIGLSLALLVMMLLCDIPKMFQDITGASFKPRKRSKGKKKPNQDLDGKDNEGASTSSAGELGNRTRTPVHLFNTVQDIEDDDWDQEKRPGSKCKSKISKEREEEEKRKSQDDMLIQL